MVNHLDQPIVEVSGCISQVIVGSLEELFHQESVWEILKPENIIRNVVVTVDNLPREKLGVQRRPVKPAMDAFHTSGTEAASLSWSLIRIHSSADFGLCAENTTHRERHITNDHFGS